MHIWVWNSFSRQENYQIVGKIKYRWNPHKHADWLLYFYYIFITYRNSLQTFVHTDWESYYLYIMDCRIHNVLMEGIYFLNSTIFIICKIGHFYAYAFFECRLALCFTKTLIFGYVNLGFDLTYASDESRNRPGGIIEGDFEITRNLYGWLEGFW